MHANDADVAPWDQMVVVGRVARSHGNKGAVIVNLDTDFPEARFRAGNVVRVQTGDGVRALRIATARFQSGRPVLTLEGVGTMGDAEALAGAELRVPEAELAELPPGTFYHHELVGCLVTTASGDVIGTVAAIEGASGAHRLLVQPPGDDRDPIDVPLAASICTEVDPQRRVIIVNPPEGLLDLNRRRSAE